MPCAEVEHQDGDQHHRRAGKGVDEELERGVDAVLAAPLADQEVHRDQAELEEDEEEHQVQRDEDADHGRLEHQHQGQECPGPLVDVEVAEVDGDRHQQRRQQHQEEADAVHAQEVGKADRRQPGHVLDELHARLRRCPTAPTAAG